MTHAVSTWVSTPTPRVSHHFGFLRRLLETRLAGAGLVISAIVVLCALAAPLLAPYDPNEQDYLALRDPPSAAHVLGTDDIGRDVLSRIIFGSRVSLEVGLFAVAIAIAAGVSLGLVAGYAGGLADDVIMRLHIWPNVTAPIVVQATLLMGTAIVTEAALSFLGVGVQPPTPSWGAMLRTGSQYLEVAPWIGMASGAAIFLTVLAFNFVGDGLRRALDPRLASRRRQ